MSSLSRRMWTSNILFRIFHNNYCLQRYFIYSRLRSYFYCRLTCFYRLTYDVINLPISNHVQSIGIYSAWFDVCCMFGPALITGSITMQYYRLCVCPLALYLYPKTLLITSSYLSQHAAASSYWSKASKLDIYYIYTIRHIYIYSFVCRGSISIVLLWFKRLWKHRVVASIATLMCNV